MVVIVAAADSIFTILYSCYYTNLESTWWILRPIFVTLELARDEARIRRKNNLPLSLVREASQNYGKSIGSAYKLFHLYYYLQVVG